MILQELVEYYENLEKNGKVPQEGWCLTKVSYAINLSKDGVITGITRLNDNIEKGKPGEIRRLKVPEKVTRSSGVSPNFLCDNAKYFLGIGADGVVDSRTRECFQAAKERHLSLLGNVNGDMAHAICLFFEKWDPEKARECQEINDSWEYISDGMDMVFCVGAEFAQDNQDIQNAWNNYYASIEDGIEGICLVTGRHCKISRLHRAIKGVAGAQSSGAPLVSFNAPAFESYGKEQSYNAPVGKYAVFAYTTALNYLLSHKKYVFHIGDTTILFWAESAEQEYQDIFFSAIDPVDNQEEIRKLFEKLEKNEAIDVDSFVLDPDQRFCILGLAPNAARLSVRFFYQDSFGKILKNISRHYKRMKIVRPSWEEREYLGIKDMLQETVNKKSKDKSPVSNTASMVLQAIISGSKYPASLYTDTLIRIRAEQGEITWGRAAIIKAFLIRNFNQEKKGVNYMGLDMDRRDTAYVLGRLFAVLEIIQRDANPGIKATIRDRYFNSACATPASIFPVLIKLKNSHMKKLERESVGSKIYYERTLSEIMEKLEYFPGRLSLEEQGKFVLGYYHQTQKHFEKKEER